MPSPLRLRIVLLLVLALLPARVLAQQEPASLTVKITAHESGQTLSDALVAVLGPGLSAISNRDGYARIPGIPPGTHVVEVRLLGYGRERIQIAFAPGAHVEGEIDLLIDPVPLQGVGVTTERRSRWLRNSGFYERKKVGIGSFLTREQIEKRRALNLSDLLRGMRGVRVVPVGHSGYAVMSSRGGVRMGTIPSSGIAVRGCFLQVFLDGMPYSLSNIDELPITWVEAIEVYRGPAETPPRFNPTGQGCGAVVIWTR